MNAFGYLVIYSWIPIVIYIFTRLPARKAIVLSFIAAWLFLPLAELKILPGIPAYTKMSATCYGVLLATILFDTKRFGSFKLSWLDLPMLIWCLCPFASSISNDLGWYDGLSSTFAQTVTWGVPYYLGRVYLNSLDGMRKLAIGIFIGGLIYMPFCLFEIRLSPMLHRLIYGFSPPESWGATMRYGGFRPEVFMPTGLMLGAWMMAATLCAVWLWQSGVIKQIWGIPVEWLALALLVTTILVKSTGALMLLVLGVAIMFIAKWFRTSLIVLVLITSIYLYLYDGASGNFSGDQISSIISTRINPERAQSLEFRFENEKILSAKARQRPIFGWGGWGRSRVYDNRGRDISVTDSLWIITFGDTGLVGLISSTALLLLPVVRFVQRYPASMWLNPKVAPAAALAVLLVLFMMDCLSNAMLNPVYTVACGGLTGLVIGETKNTRVIPVRYPYRG